MERKCEAEGCPVLFSSPYPATRFCCTFHRLYRTETKRMLRLKYELDNFLEYHRTGGILYTPEFYPQYFVRKMDGGK